MIIHTNATEVERWGLFELALEGPTTGNPFQDHTIQAVFESRHETVRADGFYDGDGIYRVRFMPSFEGAYTYTVESSFASEQARGTFDVVAPGIGNHGPVRISDTWHFSYEDGTPYHSIGTTCYVWTWQSEELIKQTLLSLESSAFNKIRFCVFPKHYDYNHNEPALYPFEGGLLNPGDPVDQRVYEWQFERFNPAYFRHFEACILELQARGIEADIIVMHPYDRWGFSNMDQETDDRYWTYLVRRLSAYRNVWWSLANEYDLMRHKTIADWERYACIIMDNDPYSHLRSIHNCGPFYDHSRPWITHCSVQRQDLYKGAELTNEWRVRYRKPVVLDEIAYEGNIQHGWGNITAEEMTRRFWESACRGGYPGHGETYLYHDDILWWSHGGKLRGESHKRFKLLLDVMSEVPGGGLALSERSSWDEVCAIPESEVIQGDVVKSYYLYYYSIMRPSFRDFYFDEETRFKVSVIDTWDMTVEERGICHGSFRVELPAKQYMAIRLKRV